MVYQKAEDLTSVETRNELTSKSMMRPSRQRFNLPQRQKNTPEVFFTTGRERGEGTEGSEKGGREGNHSAEESSEQGSRTPALRLPYAGLVFVLRRLGRDPLRLTPFSFDDVAVDRT